MNNKQRIGILLQCQGLGDCIFAHAVIKKLCLQNAARYSFDLFSWHPKLFEASPYIASSNDITKIAEFKDIEAVTKTLTMFMTDKGMTHNAVDTFDFISIPIGLDQLSFREKALEYFPTEKDEAKSFDVVINTSQTWPSRSWPAERWQALADDLLKRNLSVCVVGKDVESKADKMHKKGQALNGCVNYINQLSLDQTFFTINKGKVFVSCQNGLSVLAGATDTHIVQLDMSIEWSKRAVYRHDSPFYKISYVKGGCQLYCGDAGLKGCPHPPNNGVMHCIPSYDSVLAAVLQALE